MQKQSNLKKILEAGGFAVTGELGPPKGTDLKVIEKKAAYLKGQVDAVNVTDNQTAIVRMSSIGASHIILDMGLEPVTQMVCRDRNRIAMQSDLFGAYALGIRNMLCLSGDHQKFGNHPEAKNVFDLDSIHLACMIRKMNTEKKIMSGDEIAGDFDMFIGGAANPFGDPFEFRAIRLAKKIKAGVQFIQTQCIYDIDRFEKYMAMVREMGLHKKVYILAGITPLKSFGMANYMNKNVAGIQVPNETLKRMKACAKENQADEGIKIAVESIGRMKKIEGVSGIHIMAIEWESRVPEIVEMAKLKGDPLKRKQQE